jgi:SAM-dependent methyltransferase
VTACPVCGGEQAATGERIAFDDIWAGLESDFRTAVPADMRARYSPQPTTVLAPCESCGLRFFSPAVAAGPDLYDFLDATGYYNESTWEAAVVRELVAADDDVVDFGCGDGALLRSLGRRAGRTVGVDHAAAAVATLRGRGIEAYDISFEEFAAQEKQSFDVACAMQVLEHLPEVAPLLESCVDVLRPGGRLFIAVPNADRDTDRLEAQDCPPHHVSRWREQDLRAVGARFGFDVVEVWREPPTPGSFRLALRRGLERRVGAGRGRSQLARGLAHFTPDPWLPGLTARLEPGANLSGHSILIELRQPVADSAGT